MTIDIFHLETMSRHGLQNATAPEIQRRENVTGAPIIVGDVGASNDFPCRREKTRTVLSGDRDDPRSAETGSHRRREIGMTTKLRLEDISVVKIRIDCIDESIDRHDGVRSCNPASLCI